MTARPLAACLALSLLLPVAASAVLPELSPLKARYRITVNGVPAGTADGSSPPFSMTKGAKRSSSS